MDFEGLPAWCWGCSGFTREALKSRSSEWRILHLFFLSKIRGPSPHFDFSARGPSLELLILQQQELKTWFSLGQPDLLRQIEWSILTMNLTRMDVFVKCWAVLFYYYFETLSCRTLFLFFEPLASMLQTFGGNSQLYIFCDKIWYKVISFLWSLIKSI